MANTKLATRLALILCSCTVLYASEPCKYVVTRHGRHVTLADKRAAFSRAGISWSNHSQYVVDHIVPLELGGANDLINLQVQTIDEGKLKDRVENALAKCVCDGAMTLTEAQLTVRHWRSVDSNHPCIVRPRD